VGAAVGELDSVGLVEKFRGSCGARESAARSGIASWWTVGQPPANSDS
jgi:hypothetical protein